MKDEIKNNSEQEKTNNTSINEEIDKSINKEKQKPEDKNLTKEEKIKDLEEKLVRSLAEMENQRRRFEKEKEDAFDYGGFAFARETLNLIDNLERSKKSLENDESLKNSDTLKKTLDHLEIINRDLISIFKKNNIEPILCINKKLDPNFHQAMMEIEDDQNEPGTIIQEIQKGFMMKDRLLRPALVAVSKKTEKNTENETDDIKSNKSEENQDKSINK